MASGGRSRGGSQSDGRSQARPARHPAGPNGGSAAQPIHGSPRPDTARTEGRVGFYMARPFHRHRHLAAAVVVAAPHVSPGHCRGRPRPYRQRSDTVPCRHDDARRSVAVSAGCRIDQGAAAGGQRHDQRRGGGRCCAKAASCCIGFTCREARHSFSSISAPMANRTNAGTFHGWTRSPRRTTKNGGCGSIPPKA